MAYKVPTISEGSIVPLSLTTYRHAIQSYLTFMALNLKRLVKLLAGLILELKP